MPMPPAERHRATETRIPSLAGEGIPAAVTAGHRAEASRRETGAGLDISTEAARARFGRNPRARQSGRSGR